MTALQPRVASPCVDVCRIDAASGWCEGCLRTLDEIADWSRMDDLARRQVWLRLDERRRSMQQSGLQMPPAWGPAV
jgi:predicted Fe-S protein YdhL (DUF1289 family)